MGQMWDLHEGIRDITLFLSFLSQSRSLSHSLSRSRSLSVDGLWKKNIPFKIWKKKPTKQKNPEKIAQDDKT